MQTYLYIKHVITKTNNKCTVEKSYSLLLETVHLLPRRDCSSSHFEILISNHHPHKHTHTHTQSRECPAKIQTIQNIKFEILYNGGHLYSFKWGGPPLLFLQSHKFCWTIQLLLLSSVRFQI